MVLHVHILTFTSRLFWIQFSHFGVEFIFKFSVVSLSVYLLMVCMKKLIHCIGAGTSSLDARLLRLFTTFNMFSPSEKALHSIYGRLIQSWLDEFPLELFGNRRKLSEVGNGKYVYAVLLTGAILSSYLRGSQPFWAIAFFLVHSRAEDKIIS